MGYILYSSVTTGLTASAARFRPPYWEPVCSGQGTVVYNANDYLTAFGQYCQAYSDEANRKLTCEVEDKVEKLIKYAKKGGKSKKKRGGRY